MTKTIYKKEYINAKDVNVNDVLLDIDYPFPITDFRMTVMEKPVVDFDKMFKIVFPDTPFDYNYLNEETRDIINEVNKVYHGHEIIIDDILYHSEKINGQKKFPAHYYGLDTKLDYINGLECIIRVKPYDGSIYETDKDGTLLKNFKNYKGELYNKKPICRIVKLSDNG